MKRSLLGLSIALSGVLFLSSCNDKNKVDDLKFTPNENISIENKQLGYIYPTAGSTENASFYIDYSQGENYPVVNEHYYPAIADYSEDNTVGGTPLTFNFTIYPTSLSNVSLSIKPVYQDKMSKTELGKNGIINIYNNKDVFATLEYEATKNFKLSYAKLEEYIVSNFVVLKDYCHSNVITGQNEVSNDNSKVYEYVNFEDYICSGIEKYALLYTFKDKDEAFFNNRNLYVDKYYYLDSVGYDQDKNFSFNLKLELNNYTNINYSNLIFEQSSSIEGKLNILIKENSRLLGYAEFRSSLDLSNIYLSFLNSYFNK